MRSGVRVPDLGGGGSLCTWLGDGGAGFLLAGGERVGEGALRMGVGVGVGLPVGGGLRVRSVGGGEASGPTYTLALVV